MEVVQERQERGCLSLAAAAYIEPGHQVCPTPRLGASELGGGQLPLKSDEGQNPAPGASQAGGCYGPLLMMMMN